jgi:hypothetical protein
VDPLPTIAAPSHNLTDLSVGRLMDPNYQSPVTEEFNGGYTWSISPKSVIEVEYVHVLSLHENKTINWDAKVPIDPTNVSLGLIRPMDAAFAAAGQTRLGSVRDEMSIGRSRYDGLNFSYRQRAFHKVDLSFPTVRSHRKTLVRRSTTNGITSPLAEFGTCRGVCPLLPLSRLALPDRTMRSHPATS